MIWPRLHSWWMIKLQSTCVYIWKCGSNLAHCNLLTANCSKRSAAKVLKLGWASEWLWKALKNADSWTTPRLTEILSACVFKVILGGFMQQTWHLPKQNCLGIVEPPWNSGISHLCGFGKWTQYPGNISWLLLSALQTVCFQWEWQWFD